MKKYFSSYWIRSAFYTILQRFSLTLFGFINFMILIRGLSKNEMGIWALFLLITGVFEAMKTNLLKNAHIKFVTGNMEDQEKTAIASSSLVINTAICLVFVVLIVLLAYPLSSWLTGSTDLGLMLTWFIPGLILMVFFTHLEAIQQSHLDFKGVFAGYFVRQVLFFLFIGAHKVFHIPFSLVHLVIYQNISILLGALTLYVFTRKYMLNRFDPTRQWIRKIMGYGGYIFGSGTVANIYQNLDQLMIAKFMTTPAYVADYNAASRVNAFVDVPSYAASEVLFPQASRASAESNGKENRVKYLYERMVGILLSFTTPTALIIILFPQFFISLIAGPQYIEAAPILQLYMLTGILRPAQYQAANLLNSIGKAKLCFFINTGYLLLNLVLNYVCFLTFGFYGAAIGTLITFCIGAVIWYFVMKKEIGLELGKVFGHVIETYRLCINTIASGLQKKKPVAF